MAETRCLALVAAFLALSALPAAVLCQGPAAPKGPPNVTAVLEKGGQYSTFMRLMKATAQDAQLNSQPNGSSNDGYTVFAPTDSAFGGLKAGTLNALTQREQVSLVQYHVVARFLSPASFETASNPVRTQASGGGGPYTFNVTAGSNGQVNISTGVVATRLGAALRAAHPLAVYSVDKVLLPNDLFGVKPPTPAPAKETPPSSMEHGASVADAPAGADKAPPAAGGPRVAAWSLAAVLTTAAATLL